MAEPDRPVAYVTNGVHVPTWIAGRAGRAVRRRISAPAGCDRQDDPALWDGVLAIPDEELWAVRQSLRRYLFTFVRERARQRWTEERVGTPRVVAAGTLLDPDALTIGFARRFTGYKRPELIFHDAERLARILNAPGRPVQIIFAGKSHPADDIGKHHLQRVYRRALDPLFGGRVAFVDDYDLHVAHFLVQGCDVWLNNPRKPLEASGTSGMKAAHQRRPAPEHRRRLVGRRLHRHQRLGDRRRRRRRQPRRGRRRRRRRAVPAARGGSRARRSTIATPTACPRRWLRVVKEVDPLGRAALLGAADGQGIRRAHVQPALRLRI